MLAKINPNDIESIDAEVDGEMFIIVIRFKEVYDILTYGFLDKKRFITSLTKLREEISKC